MHAGATLNDRDSTRWVWAAGSGEPVGVSKDNLWHYWVTYSYRHTSGFPAQGQAEIYTEHPLVSREVILKVRDAVHGLAGAAPENLSETIILNWKLIQVPEGLRAR